MAALVKVHLLKNLHLMTLPVTLPPKAGAWLSISALSAKIDKSNSTLCTLCVSSERK